MEASREVLEHHNQVGCFHFTCCLMSAIDKRFQDAGLRDLCVESVVIADGSIAAVLKGESITEQSGSISCCMKR